MDDKQRIEAFHKAIASVCLQFGVHGMVGIWFAGNVDHYGLIKLHPPTDADMRIIVQGVADKFNAWADLTRATTPKQEDVYEVDLFITQRPDQN